MNRSRSRGPLGAAALAACAVLLAAALPGCAREPRYHSGGGLPAAKEGPGLIGSTWQMTLNRGDWLVGDQTGVWKAWAESATGGRPDLLGYMTSRNYRQVRGGPAFTMYEVTTKDRDEHVGMIDSLGNATRFVRQRDGGFDTADAGNNTLELDVQAIFATLRPVTLERTTERRLAFEGLDANGDGALAKEEWPRATEREVDRNRDGKADFQEFDRIDVL